MFHKDRLKNKKPTEKCVEVLAFWSHCYTEKTETEKKKITIATLNHLKGYECNKEPFFIYLFIIIVSLHVTVEI